MNRSNDFSGYFFVKVRADSRTQPTNIVSLSKMAAGTSRYRPPPVQPGERAVPGPSPASGRLLKDTRRSSMAALLIWRPACMSAAGRAAAPSGWRRRQAADHRAMQVALLASILILSFL